jgi:hypothetical protein
MLFAYFAPEVAMPVASVFATLVGIVLAGGRPVVGWMARRARAARGWAGTGRDSSPSESHAGVSERAL